MMLNPLRPAARPSNPVFRFELARRTGSSKPGSLRTFSRRILGVTLVLAVLWWGLLLLQSYAASRWGFNNQPRSVYTYSVSYYNDITAGMLSLLILGAILVSFIADFRYMLITFTTINRQVKSGQWSLLRLTSMPEAKILSGVYGAAEVRAGRTMIIDMAFRVILVGFIALCALLPPVWIIQLANGVTPPYPPMIPVLSDLHSLTHALGAVITFIIVSAAYILEPLWRMRAMLTIGIAISARFHEEPSAGVVSSIVGPAIRLAEGGLLGAMFFFGIYFSDFAYQAAIPHTTTFRNADLASFLAFALVLICNAAVCYAYFRWVKYRAYCYLRKWAFRPE